MTRRRRTMRRGRRRGRRARRNQEEGEKNEEEEKHEEDVDDGGGCEGEGNVGKYEKDYDVGWIDQAYPFVVYIQGGMGWRVKT